MVWAEGQGKPEKVSAARHDRKPVLREGQQGWITRPPPHSMLDPASSDRELGLGAAGRGVDN